MRPGQLSQQCRDNFVALVSLEELPHTEQFGAREPAQSRLRSCQMLGQFSHYTITPFCHGNRVAAPCNMSPETPTISAAKRQLPSATAST